MGFEEIRMAERAAAGRRSQSGSFGACLAAAMRSGRGGSGTFRQCADAAGLAEKFAGVWTPENREAVSSAMRSLWAGA